MIEFQVFTIWHWNRINICWAWFLWLISWLLFDSFKPPFKLTRNGILESYQGEVVPIGTKDTNITFKEHNILFVDNRLFNKKSCTRGNLLLPSLTNHISSSCWRGNSCALIASVLQNRNWFPARIGFMCICSFWNKIQYMPPYKLVEALIECRGNLTRGLNRERRTKVYAMNQFTKNDTIRVIGTMNLCL